MKPIAVRWAFCKINIYTMTQLLFLGLGLQEIVFIALIILLLFGGKKIPELMRGLGQGVKSFKDGMKEVSEDSKQQGKGDGSSSPEKE